MQREVGPQVAPPLFIHHQIQPMPPHVAASREEARRAVARRHCGARGGRRGELEHQAVGLGQPRAHRQAVARCAPPRRWPAPTPARGRGAPLGGRGKRRAEAPAQPAGRLRGPDGRQPDASHGVAVAVPACFGAGLDGQVEQAVEGRLLLWWRRWWP
jgi:hypothetical protein